MPDNRGMILNEGNYVEPGYLYRTIAAADVNSAANIEALTEVIDTENRRWMFKNILHVQAIVPASVTSYDIEIWGSMDHNVTGLTLGGERWGQIAAFTGLARSAVKSVYNIFPGQLKVLITNVSGDFTGGSAYILAARSI